MSKAYRLAVRVSGDSKDAQRAMRDLTRSANRMSSGMKRAFTSVAKAGAVGIGVGLALAVREGTNELIDMQKANAQTMAGIKSTGGVAKVTAKDTQRLSNALMLKSGVDDQLIQSGANLLLTFTKVRNEMGRGNKVFDRATQAALDLSVKGFGSMEATSKMLGKALNDPVKGISALSRAGVTFTQKQKDTIKSLVATGKTLQAQKLILKEVETQVGGSAAAYGKTIPGQLGKAREAFSALAAQLVVKLLPAFNAALVKVNEWVARLQVWANSKEGQRTLADLGNAFRAVGRVISATGRFLLKYRSELFAAAAGIVVFVAALKTMLFIQKIIVLIKAWRAGQIALNIALLANPIGLIIAAVAGLVVGLVLAYRHSERFRNVVHRVWQALKDNWQILLLMVPGVGMFATAIVTAYRKSETFRRVVKGTGVAIRTAFGGIASMVLGIADAISSLIKKVEALNRKLASVKKSGGGAGGVALGAVPVVGPVLNAVGKVSAKGAGFGAKAAGGGINAIGQISGNIGLSDALGYARNNNAPTSSFLNERISINTASINGAISERAGLPGQIQAQRQKVSVLGAQLRKLIGEHTTIEKRWRNSKGSARKSLGNQLRAKKKAIKTKRDALAAAASRLEKLTGRAEELPQEILQLADQVASDMQAVEELSSAATGDGISDLGGAGTDASGSLGGGGAGGAGGAGSVPLTQLVIRQTFTGQPDLFAASRQAAWAARTAGLVLT